jgi:hypothetical protein
MASLFVEIQMLFCITRFLSGMARCYLESMSSINNENKGIGLEKLDGFEYFKLKVKVLFVHIFSRNYFIISEPFENI